MYQCTMYRRQVRTIGRNRTRDKGSMPVGTVCRDVFGIVELFEKGDKVCSVVYTTMYLSVVSKEGFVCTYQ